MSVLPSQQPVYSSKVVAGRLFMTEKPVWISHAYSLQGLIAPLLFLLGAWLIFPYDAWIAYHCHKLPAGEPEWLRNILDNVEPFGHGVGIIIAALAVASLDYKQRRLGFTVFCAGAGSGLMADLFKLFVCRIRPRSYDFGTLETQATITRWMPLFDGGSGSQSFPSAHTATAVGLAIVLSSFYPRAWGLFALMAVLATGHRLHAGAHYPSDLLVGAAIGWLIGLWCVRFVVRYNWLASVKPEDAPRAELSIAQDKSMAA